MLKSRVDRAVCVCILGHSVLSDPFVTPWPMVRQAPPSMDFPRQEYWSGMPFPPPEDLLDPGIELESPVSPALAGRFFTTGKTGLQSHLFKRHLLSTDCALDAGAKCPALGG